MSIRREIEKRTGRGVSIGAIYATLERLEKKGFLTVAGGRLDAGPRWKITPALRTSTRGRRSASTVSRHALPNVGRRGDRRGIEHTVSVPPPIARWILRQLAGSTHGDAMVGDLDEEFHEHVVGERSLFAVRMWYRAQVIKSLSPTLLKRARRAGKNRQSGKMGDGMMSTFLNDLRCALRGVRKSPAFALTLAVVGIFAVVSFAVGERTQKIGLRVALGAEGGQVRSLMIRQAMVPVALGRVMFGLLFGVSETNPVTLASVALLFGVVALVAS